MCMTETQNVQCVYFWFVHHFRYIEVYVICISEKKPQKKYRSRWRKTIKHALSLSYCLLVYVIFFLQILVYSAYAHAIGMSLPENKTTWLVLQFDTESIKWVRKVCYVYMYTVPLDCRLSVISARNKNFFQ